MGQINTHRHTDAHSRLVVLHGLLQGTITRCCDAVMLLHKTHGKPGDIARRERSHRRADCPSVNQDVAVSVTPINNTSLSALSSYQRCNIATDHIGFQVFVMDPGDLLLSDDPHTQSRIKHSANGAPLRQGAPELTEFFAQMTSIKLQLNCSSSHVTVSP